MLPTEPEKSIAPPTTSWRPLGWLFVFLAPFLSLLLVNGINWAPSWLFGMRMFTGLVVLFGVILLVILVRAWRRNTANKTSRIFAVVLTVVLSLYYFLCFLSLSLAFKPYEIATRTFEISLASGQHTFYICPVSSWQYFFDGGYEVWVREPGSAFVEQVGRPVWKSEFDGNCSVEGNLVRFHFYDDNPFSERGSGDTYIDYLDR